MQNQTSSHFFREHHLLSILIQYESLEFPPLDVCISRYLRANKAIGSKDRAYIAETIYQLVRWQGLIDALIPEPLTWEKRLAFLLNNDLRELVDTTDLLPHDRVSFPKVLHDLITNSHGEAKAKELCLISNEMAPTTIRINTLKTSREALLAKWRDHYQVSPCVHSPEAIVFRKKVNFFTLPEFKEGLFEIQDEGSQLLSKLVQAKPQQQVMDYCAGSGGKTLAFAPGMKGTGQIFLHDIREFALMEAKQRLRRAGIQNAQSIKSNDPHLKRLKKQMDWVLVDAPCTGTGTMRRNPDMKWRFDQETLPRLVGQQRMIFEKALSYVKPGGRIVYGTCSLLQEENQEQVDHFVKTYGLTVEGEPFQSLPSSGGMDGFFGIVLVTPTKERKISV